MFKFLCSLVRCTVMHSRVGDKGVVGTPENVGSLGVTKKEGRFWEMGKILSRRFG